MKKSGDIAALLAAISAPRLSSYRTFFQPQSDEELLGIYRWHEDLSIHFNRLLRWVEITMRNRFHAALSVHHGTQGAAGSRDWYNCLALPAHSADSVKKITHRPDGRLRQPAPKPDDVVAKLTLGFWPSLLEVDQDLAGRRMTWGHTIPLVVPGHRHSNDAYWRTQVHRDALRARLDLSTYLRNRIAHQEPIWKQGVLFEETRPRHRRVLRMVAHAPATPAQSLARLQLEHDRLMELMHWLSPAVATMLKQDPEHHSGQQLLQDQILQAYRQGQR